MNCAAKVLRSAGKRAKKAKFRTRISFQVFRLNSGRNRQLLLFLRIFRASKLLFYAKSPFIHFYASCIVC